MTNRFALQSVSSALLLIFAGLLCLAPPLRAAQETSGKPAPSAAAKSDAPKKEEFDPKTTTRVTLGSSSGTPGDAVVVPIYFTPAEGARIGTLKIEVSFVSVNLKFEKTDRGIAAEMGEVQLVSDVKDSKNDKGVDTSTLVLRATAPEAAKTPIPAGLLGYLTLKISDKGRPATIALRTTAEGTELGSSKPLANLKALDAEVEVMAPGTQPAVACFFFSH
jgi:hypothetical protein